MGWRLRLSDKTVRKLAELPIYCQRQKRSPGNVVSGSVRFMQIVAWVRWRGASNETGVVENGDFRFIRSLSSEHFTYVATRQLSGDTAFCHTGSTTTTTIAPTTTASAATTGVISLLFSDTLQKSLLNGSYQTHTPL